MTDQDNVQLIRKLYDAFGRGDIQTILDNVAPGAGWNNYGPESVPYFGSRKGHAQIVEFFQAIGATTTGGRVDAESFIASGGKVVALGRYSATVRSNGLKIDTPIAHIFTIQDGKITAWEGFSDTAHVAAAHAAAAGAAG